MSKLPPTSVSLSPERMARFQEYAAEYPNLRSALMMTIRLVEEEFGSVTDEAMQLVADLCQVNVAHVQDSVTSRNDPYTSGQITSKGSRPST